MVVKATLFCRICKNFRNEKLMINIIPIEMKFRFDKETFEIQGQISFKERTMLVRYSPLERANGWHFCGEKA